MSGESAKTKNTLLLIQVCNDCNVKWWLFVTLRLLICVPNTEQNGYMNNGILANFCHYHFKMCEF